MQAVGFVSGLQVLEIDDEEDDDMSWLQGLFVHTVEVFVWVDREEE